jgi:putative DNA primase/helicase
MGAEDVAVPDTLSSPTAQPNGLQEPEPLPAPPARAGQQDRRRKTLVSLAGTMNKRGMGLEAIEAALLAENAAKCDPPLSESEVRNIAADIVKRYPPVEPTAATEPKAQTLTQEGQGAQDRHNRPATGALAKAKDVSAQNDERPAEYADDALALRFTERHGDDLRFTAAWGRWSVWDGSVWRSDETLRVFDLARRVCREQSAGCSDERLASRIASAMTVSACERLARADRRHAATVDQWDSDPWLLNTRGGMVDLRNGAMRPARREDYATKITAAAPGGECPLWKSFLSRITGGDEELQGFLQRMSGYALTGVTREHALFFLYGLGANGKSVFVNTLSGVMGDYARTAPIEAFIDSKSERHPTDLAGLQGARLVSATETEDGRRWAESKLKALTGGDKIAARFMRADFFEFTPQFKLVVAGNHRPGLRTVDEAMRRRFNLVPFTVTIPPGERDLQLAENLRKEWGAILQWAIDGCLAWQNEGLRAPKAVSEATAEYLAAEDALARWLEDRTEKRDGAWVSATALFADWTAWAESNREYTGTQKRFSENLAARGYAQARTKAARGFSGLRLHKNQQLTSPVTDSDGSTGYTRYARARDTGNGTTRHHASPDGQGAVKTSAEEEPEAPEDAFAGLTYEEAERLCIQAEASDESSDTSFNFGFNEPETAKPEKPELLSPTKEVWL